MALRFGQWPLDRPAHQVTAAQAALLAAVLTAAREPRPQVIADAPARLTPAELAELARRHEERING